MDDMRKTKKELVQELQHCRERLNALQDISSEQDQDYAAGNPALYHAMVGHTMDVITILDDNGLIYYESPAIEQVLGYHPKELIGEPPLKYVHEEDCANVTAALKKIRKQPGRVETIDFRFRHKDGSWRYFEGKGRLFNGQDRENFVIVNIHDITERKNNEDRVYANEQKLLESNERFRRLAEASFEGIVIHENGVVIDCNQVFAEMFGYSQQDIIGINALDLIPEQSRATVRKNIREQNTQPYEHWALRKDGTQFLCESRGRPFPHKGRTVRMTAIRDISERKQIEQALKETNENLDQKISERTEELSRINEQLQHSEETIRSLFNAITESAFLIDRQGIVLLTNATFAKRMGTEPQAIIGKAVYEFIPKHTGRNRRSYVQEVIKTRRPVRFEDERFGRIIHNSIYPVFDADGNVKQLAVFGYDITQQKEAEKALKESEERYKLVTEATEQGIWDWNVVDNTVFFSRQWKKQIGYREHELANEFKTWQDHLHPDDYERCMQALQDYLQNPKGKFKLQFRFRHKKGHYVWISNTAAAIKDKDGNVIRMFGAHTDITELKHKQDLLRESEQKYKTLSESSKDQIFIIDSDMKVRYLNKTAAKVLRAKPATIIGKHLNELIPHDIAKSQIANLKKVFKNGKSYSTISETEYPTGRVWLDTTLVPLKNGERKIAAVMGVSRDVTKSKRIELQLAASEEKHRAIFEAATDAFIIADYEGKIVEVNPAACQLYGYNRDEFLELNASNLVQENHRYKIRDFIVSVKKTGAYQGNTLDVRKDGSTFYTDINGAQINFQNKPHLLAVVRDISEKIKAEQKLKDSEKKFHTLYDQSPDMHVSVSPKTAKIIECNETLLENTGYSREEIIGKPIFDMYDDSIQDEVQKAFKQFIDTGRIRNKELILKKKDGSTIDVSLNTNVLRDEGGHIMQSMSSWRDISEQKAMRKELQDNEERFRLLV
ncbi:MAG: PAS domain S-box protein, partial [Caldithrix sp.]|nr:PAS domain S-box protein [Caldithrix sp.]